MRSTLKSLLVALFVLLSLSSHLHAQVAAEGKMLPGTQSSSTHSAQVADGSGEVSGTIGFNNLAASETVDGYHHVNFGGSIAYVISNMGSIGFEYGYQSLGSETQSGATVSGHIQSYGGVYRGSLIPSGREIPYLLVAGGGLSETAIASAGNVKVSATQNGSYFGFGGGVSVYAGPNWGIRPEFRYERQHFLATTIDGYSVAASDQNYVMGTVSVFYRFGGRAAKKK